MTPAEYRARRTALGYTQAALAARLGVSRETISRREAGHPEAAITREAALALAALPAHSRPARHSREHTAR